MHNESVNTKTKEDKNKLKLTKNEYFINSNQHQFKSHTQKALTENFHNTDHKTPFTFYFN